MTTIPKFTSETFAPDENSNRKQVNKPAAIKTKATMGEDYDDEDEEPIKKPFGSTNLSSFEDLANLKYKKKQLDIDNDQ